MAQIPRAALDYLTKEINGISADAKAKVLRVAKSSIGETCQSAAMQW